MSLKRGREKRRCEAVGALTSRFLRLLLPAGCRSGSCCSSAGLYQRLRWGRKPSKGYRNTPVSEPWTPDLNQQKKEHKKNIKIFKKKAHRLSFMLTGGGFWLFQRAHVLKRDFHRQLGLNPPNTPAAPLWAEETNIWMRNRSHLEGVPGRMAADWRWQQQLETGIEFSLLQVRPARSAVCQLLQKKKKLKSWCSKVCYLTLAVCISQTWIYVGNFSSNFEEQKLFGKFFVS